MKTGSQLRELKFISTMQESLPIVERMNISVHNERLDLGQIIHTLHT